MLRNIKWKLTRKVTEVIESLCSHSKLYDSDKEGGGSARCVTCNRYMGFWFCPQSPDNRCYYYSEPNGDGSRHVQLENGVKHQLTKEWRDDDAEHETDDDCLFCHHPEERK